MSTTVFALMALWVFALVAFAVSVGVFAAFLFTMSTVCFLLYGGLR